MISMRYLYYAGSRSSVMGNISDCEIARRMYADTVHPSQLGQVLYADVLISMLADAEAPERHLMPQGPQGQGASTDMIEPHLDGLRRGLLDDGWRYIMPAPLSPGGADVWLMRCYGEMTIAQEEQSSGGLSPLLITSNEGWVHVVNQTHVKHPGAIPKYKPGWVSARVGATLHLHVDTLFSRERAGVVAKAKNATVILMFLRSYQHMGMVSVQCVAHCSCSPIVIDAHHEDKVSISCIADLVGVTPHAECTVGVTILPGSSSADGEHKFKLLQVVAKVLSKGVA